MIVIASMNKGCTLVNEAKIAADLEANLAVVAEAIQNILRREGYLVVWLKELTRTNRRLSRKHLSIY